jgi:hypothetical protein
VNAAVRVVLCPRRIDVEAAEKELMAGAATTATDAFPVAVLLLVSVTKH